MKRVSGVDVPVEMGAVRDAEWCKLRDALGLVDVGERQPFVDGPGGWPPAFGVPGASRGFRCLQGDGVSVFALWRVFRAFVWDGCSLAFCDGVDALGLVEDVLGTMQMRDGRDERRGRILPAGRAAVRTRFEEAKVWMEVRDAVGD